VAGLSQLAGEFMLVKPLVIDLGWGAIKSALDKLPDSGFVSPQEATAQRQALVKQYVAAFRHVEAGGESEARVALNSLSGNISASMVKDQQASLHALVEGQLAKLA
jgi:hypothetical protein